ncbi:MAG: hypothetical protein AAF216_08705 [Pseudomonadota bacterium]
MSGAVNIRQCASLEEAVVVWSALRAHGFESNISNFEHAWMHWFKIPAFGGVFVTVPHAQLNDAQDCLADLEDIARRMLDDEHLNVDHHLTRRDRWRIWALSIFGPYSTFPFLFGNAVWQSLRKSMLK